jgi:hypothetical protein
LIRRKKIEKRCGAPLNLLLISGHGMRSPSLGQFGRNTGPVALYVEARKRQGNLVMDMLANMQIELD